MPLAPGTRLGVFEVVAMIGAGGMGEVYRGRDTRLNRDVALKVLPDLFARDADRLSRFKREAQLLASLSHPNIAIIHGLEESEHVLALVLELVEGPTLADRLSAGAIPVDEALAIARQICDAIESAHETGVVHRDLKPANIKLKTDGIVKVLDFGLAKLTMPGEGSSAGAGAQMLSMSPTMTSPAMTQMGVILGTAAYMAPEQARGRATDKRADIWAFGCVLFEMIAGRRPFDGEDVAETIGAVIHKDVPWAALPATTPPVVRTVLERCLQKDPKQRIRDIGDVRLALDGAFGDAGVAQRSWVAQGFSPAPQRRQRQTTVAIGAAAAVVGALAAGSGVWFAIRPSPRQVVRLTATHPPPDTVGVNAVGTDVLVTPDGRRIVYVAVGPAQRRLYVRPLDQLVATQLGTMNNVGAIAMSPDGQWVAFADGSDQTLKKIAISGGPAVAICKLTSAMISASWGADDRIIFDSNTSNVAGGLWRVPAAGGTPEQLTKTDGQNEFRHLHPDILPGGQALLFRIEGPQSGAERWQVAVLDLKTGDRKTLVKGGSTPRYSPTGHLVYSVAATLLAVPFDLDRLAVVGNPIPVVESVSTTSNGTARFTFAQDGTLVYVQGNAASGARRGLVWVTRDGKEEPIDAPRRAYAYARLSPDGTRVALDVRDEMDDIWIWTFSRRTLTRLTFDPGVNRSPVWSADGRRVAFTIEMDGAENVYWQAADGSGAAEPLTKNAEQRFFPTSFSPDGTRLVFDRPAPPRDIGIVMVDRAGEPELLLKSTFEESNGEISRN